jgi:hypothetical protein
MPVEIEVVRNIYSEDSFATGAYIQVGPDCDGLDNVRICTQDAVSRDYWGAIDFNLSTEMATALAHAILAAVKDQTNS